MKYKKKKPLFDFSEIIKWAVMIFGVLLVLTAS